MEKVSSINSSNRQKVEQKLLNRFYIIKEHGRNKEFYDTSRGQSGVMTSALYSVALKWLNSDSWSEAKDLIINMRWRTLTIPNIYRPNGLPVVTDEDSISSLNLWQEPVLEDGSLLRNRIGGDPAVFIQHLVRCLGSQEKADYLLDILAWRRQNPNANKAHICFYLYGAIGGTGKSTFVETLARVLGSSAVKQMNTSDGITSKGAVDCWATSWVVIEEANIKHGGTYDTIKSYTGSDTVQADAKHTAFRRYEVPAMLILLSNRAPTFIEAEDRRFFVSEWTLDDMTKAERSEYFKEHRLWLDDGGIEAIAGHLETRAVTRNVYEAAPVTPEKSRAMTVAANPVTLMIADMLEDNPEKVLFTKDVFASLFKDNNVGVGLQKFILNDAGLELLTTRTKINGEQSRVWGRNGATLVPTAGKSTLVEYQGKQQLVADVVLQAPPSEF